MDLVYALPTPVPKGHVAVEAGTSIALPRALASQHGRPVFIHFFNPRCPCSRFNLPTVRRLIRRFRERVDFRVVVMLPEGKELPRDGLQAEFDADIPISFDRSVASLCGVYSTPQAVLIDAQGSLYFRGNYNTHRYCVAEATNFARIAIEALLGDVPSTPTTRSASVSYGCSLPVCTKE
jgi:hypothetical protein